jgi:phosphoglycolate phosphatase
MGAGVNSPRARAVIWDLDGTLVDSVADLATALNGVLGGHGLEPRTLGAVRRMIGDGVAELVRRGFEAAGRPLAAAEVPDLRREFMARYGECATRQTRPMPGAAEVLARLSDDGWRHAVCTNKPAGISRDILGALDLSRWIDAVVGGDEGLPLKPDPAPVRACLEALGLAPDRAVMVGDSVNDAAAARAAGVPVVFVRSGYGRSPGTDPDADACVDGLGEVPPIVTRLSGAGGRSHP